MITAIEVPFWHKSAEEDSYEEGCIGMSVDSGVSIPLAGADRAALERAIRGTFGVEADAIQWDACEEPGRIDVAKQETDDGMDPSEVEYAQWRRGELRLWYVIYTGYASRVTRTPCTFTEEAQNA